MRRLKEICEGRRCRYYAGTFFDGSPLCEKNPRETLETPEEATPGIQGRVPNDCPFYLEQVVLRQTFSLLQPSTEESLTEKAISTKQGKDG